LYNTFVETNILTDTPSEKISRIIALIGAPARTEILLIIAGQEACVCHLEAVTGMRQASISQHLMVLRKAGLVTHRRIGRNIFYGLARPEVVQVLQQAAAIAGITPDGLQMLTRRPVEGCNCPQCCPDLDPQQTCKKPCAA
jgi:ArsR family transcriptional regulator